MNEYKSVDFEVVYELIQIMLEAHEKGVDVIWLMKGLLKYI